MSVCRLCGCVLAHDHDHDAVYCTPCSAARRDYDPHHDPHFREELLALLQANRGRPVHVYRALGIEHCGEAAWWCVKAHVRFLRRRGYVIPGHHAGTYTLVSGPAAPRAKAP